MTPDIDAGTNLEVTLRMMASLRRDAERYSEKEGVSLDQFVNVAVAEKLAHLQHEDWVRNRRPVDEARRARALALLTKSGNGEVELGDEIPEGYVRPGSRG